MDAETVKACFEWLASNNPDPKTELIYHSPFQLLIAVILSAQATDISVNKATGPLFEIAPDAKSLLALGIEGLKSYIRQIGLFNSKARHIIQTCEILVNQYDGKIPRTRGDLECLPGVGRKTANVILNTLYNEPVIAVDTHIFRVANRLGLVEAKTVNQAEKQLLEVIPSEFIPKAHHWLVLQGRYICIARKPRCQDCGLRSYCHFYQQQEGSHV